MLEACKALGVEASSGGAGEAGSWRLQSKVRLVLGLCAQKARDLDGKPAAALSEGGRQE